MRLEEVLAQAPRGAVPGTTGRSISSRDTCTFGISSLPTGLRACSARAPAWSSRAGRSPSRTRCSCWTGGTGRTRPACGGSTARFDYDEEFWKYASESSLPDLAADLIGPDVKFRESLINYKWAGGGDEVRWHQDLPYYPHTNTCAILMLTCLEDVASDQAPLMVVPRSHHLGLLEHYDREDKWLGRVCDEDLEHVPIEEAVELTGGAGTLIVLHGCIVHGSRHNLSDRNRPLLTCGYSAADAFCYTPFASGQASRYAWRIVRGKPAMYAHHEAVRFRLPPDYSDTFTSIFEMQKGQQPGHASS